MEGEVRSIGRGTAAHCPAYSQRLQGLLVAAEAQRMGVRKGLTEQRQVKARDEKSDANGLQRIFAATA